MAQAGSIGTTRGAVEASRESGTTTCCAQTVSDGGMDDDVEGVTQMKMHKQ